MIGIPFRLRTQSDEGGEVERVIYLRSRRAGDAAKAFRDAKQKCRKLEWALLKAERRYATLEKRCDAAAGREDELQAVMDQREAALEAMQLATEQVVEAMERLVKLALQPNYGAETESILDAIKDSDLPTLVSAIETGEVPSSFFAGAVQPGWSTATSASGESSIEPSLNGAGQRETSSAAE